jgi:hypothetical protein
MTLECALCSNQSALGFPGRIDFVKYDLQRDVLAQKVTIFCARVFCESCFNNMTRVARDWDTKELIKYFTQPSERKSVEVIFECAISGCDRQSLLLILDYCIYHVDGETIKIMQQREPKISRFLKIIFYECLNKGNLRGANFIVNNFVDFKPKVDCLVDFGGFFTKKGKFDLAKDYLIRALNFADEIKDMETKSVALINVGYEIATLTEKLIPLFKEDEIKENIFLIKDIISKLDYHIDAGVFFGRINLYLQMVVEKLLLAHQIEKATEVAKLFPYRSSREFFLKKIEFFEKV